MDQDDKQTLVAVVTWVIMLTLLVPWVAAIVGVGIRIFRVLAGW